MFIIKTLITSYLVGLINCIIRLSLYIVLLSVQENLADRPTMATIILMLNSYSLSLPTPAEPAFYMNSRTRSLPEMQSWEYNSRELGTSELILKSAKESEN